MRNFRITCPRSSTTSTASPAPGATTVKSLRRASEANGRDASIFDFLTEERDPSGFKYRIRPEVQLELFRFAIERIAQGKATPALCKEDESLWQQLGMKFRGCHCLLGAADELAAGTFPELRPGRSSAPRAAAKTGRPRAVDDSGAHGP